MRTIHSFVVCFDEINKKKTSSWMNRPSNRGLKNKIQSVNYTCNLAYFRQLYFFFCFFESVIDHMIESFQFSSHCDFKYFIYIMWPRTSFAPKKFITSTYCLLTKKCSASCSWTFHRSIKNIFKELNMWDVWRIDHFDIKDSSTLTHLIYSRTTNLNNNEMEREQ